MMTVVDIGTLQFHQTPIKTGLCSGLWGGQQSYNPSTKQGTEENSPRLQPDQVSGYDWLASEGASCGLIPAKGKK